MRTLQIVRSAYRCNAEEQDDPVLWIAQALRNAGAQVSLLLRGTAVNYAVAGQDASGLRFGSRVQAMAPRIERDLEALMSGGSPVYLLAEDLRQLGIAPADLVPGVIVLRLAEVPDLLSRFQSVWHW